MNEITKAEAKRALGIATDVDFAGWFAAPATKQAVGRWPADEPLPSSRQWELRARRPDIFGPPPTEPPVQAEESRDAV